MFQLKVLKEDVSNYEYLDARGFALLVYSRDKVVRVIEEKNFGSFRRKISAISQSVELGMKEQFCGFKGDIDTLNTYIPIFSSLEDFQKKDLVFRYQRANEFFEAFNHLEVEDQYQYLLNRFKSISSNVNSAIKTCIEELDSLENRLKKPLSDDQLGLIRHDLQMSGTRMKEASDFMSPDLKKTTENRLLEIRKSLACIAPQAM